MGRSNIANCKYVCDAINKKMGYNVITPVSGTAQRAANKNYLIGCINKFRRPTLSPINGDRAVNCGTVDDAIANYLQDIYIMEIYNYTEYINNFDNFCYLIFDNINRTVTKVNGSVYNPASSSIRINSNTTCIGGYLGVINDQNGSKWQNWMQQRGWNYSGSFINRMIIAAQSNTWSSGGQVTQDFTFDLRVTTSGNPFNITSSVQSQVSPVMANPAVPPIRMQSILL